MQVNLQILPKLEVLKMLNLKEMEFLLFSELVDKMHLTP